MEANRASILSNWASTLSLLVDPVELLVNPVELALHAVEPAVDVAVTGQDQCAERRADTDDGPEFLAHAWTPRSR